MKAILHTFGIGFATLSCLLLTGCGMNSGARVLENKQASLVAQGNPPAYIDGYLDGCASGKRAAGNRSFSYTKDQARYERDALYARGWQEGQVTCRNEEIIAVQQEQEREAALSYTSIDEERRRRVDAESRRADIEAREIWEELKK